jgi:hypothetical protein
MRKLFLIAALLTSASMSGMAMANDGPSNEMWRARNWKLDDLSPGICRQYQDGYRYVFIIDAGVLTMDGPNGRSFAVKVGPEGTIKHEFRSPNGGNYLIYGNAFSRDLIIQNLGSHCSARMVPE